MRDTVLYSGFDNLKLNLHAELPEELIEQLRAKQRTAQQTGAPVLLSAKRKDGSGELIFTVRATGGTGFSLSTGETGAEIWIADPDRNRPGKPTVTIDFRAYLLAVGGLGAAEEHFKACMKALKIPLDDVRMGFSRVDFAVDLMTAGFKPNVRSLVLPPNTRSKVHGNFVKYARGEQIETITAGAVSNRQLCIYDKIAAVKKSGAEAWLSIWNRRRAEEGLAPLDLDDPDQQIWRFEMRLGGKQLRRRWAINSWADLDATVGDAFHEFVDQLRYVQPTTDSNRSRWPDHPLWRLVREAIAEDIALMRSGVCPEEIRQVDRAAFLEQIDRQILGCLVSRAAAQEIPTERFEGWVHSQAKRLIELSRRHPISLHDRMLRAVAKKRFV